MEKNDAEIFEELEKKADEALEQIEKNKYDEELKIKSLFSSGWERLY